ncbi:DUF4873 domain-containing protein [Nocardioides sp.]|uniref:DUF4873 domain-containing protein n=1 Tax=Nocardioides sp. TaxID=35761 RepID=UPI002736305E|nr:DUF4873 domain-containing protein [Nocardioides sp.]MDP3894279.1 DUF4873 domain-containing protein [Nocardioides sp.]
MTGEDGYAGPATLLLDGEEVSVEVHLAGHLEPLDGLFHWYGRITRDEAVDAWKAGGGTTAELLIPDEGSAPARLAEHDPWGNLRITGVGPPPYALEPVEVDLRPAPPPPA